MDLETFEDLLDRHGGDLEMWPKPARAAARALVEASPAARALLDVMREVEAVLCAGRIAAVRVDDVDRVAARAMRRPQETHGRRAATWVGWGAAAAAMLVLGIMVGGVAPGAASVGPDRILAASLEPGDLIDVE